MRCCRLYRGSREGAVAIVRRRAKPERPSRASPIRLRDALRATLRPFADVEELQFVLVHASIAPMIRSRLAAETQRSASLLPAKDLAEGAALVNAPASARAASRRSSPRRATA